MSVKMSQVPSWFVDDKTKEIKRKYETNIYDTRSLNVISNNKIDLRKIAIERNIDTENLNLELAINDEDVKKLYQNSLLGVIAPHDDYWDDSSSSMYHPTSEWTGPSGLIWLNR